MKELLSVNDVSFRYQSSSAWILNNVNLSVQKGEWVAILGHNGSGKSTLAKTLNGLLFPEKGFINVEGIVLNKDNIWEIRKRVGMVFQNPDNQFVGATVRDDVAFGLENIGVPRDEIIKRITESLTQVGMLDYLDQEPHFLSGGQKQRVAIAGIFALRPSLMILDEATSMLDPIGRTEVIRVIRHLKESYEMSVISITHDLEEVIHADRVIVMNKGEVLMTGTPNEVFQHADTLLAIGLDVPFSIRLSRALKEKGIPLSKNHLKQEDLVEELWTLKSKA